ncbi:MAG: hypothetical protein ACFCUL_06975 [Flavobacteriaceae bacterium]
MTSQFAVIEEAYRKTGELSIQVDNQYGVSSEKRQIVVKLHFRFYKMEPPFISIVVACYFEIDKKGWKQLINENGDVLLPKTLLSHLTVLTVGTTRGILHSKTEGTKYNKYILPTINVNQLVEEDVLFTADELV